MVSQPPAKTAAKKDRLAVKACLKKTGTALGLLLLLGCNEEGPREQNMITLDSNTILQDDSIPPTLYLDSTRNDSAVAMDSAGRTITPKDTNYAKKK